MPIDPSHWCTGRETPQETLERRTTSGTAGKPNSELAVEKDLTFLTHYKNAKYLVGVLQAGEIIPTNDARGIQEGDPGWEKNDSFVYLELNGERMDGAPLTSKFENGTPENDEQYPSVVFVFSPTVLDGRDDFHAMPSWAYGACTGAGVGMANDASEFDLFVDRLKRPSYNEIVFYNPVGVGEGELLEIWVHPDELDRVKAKLDQAGITEIAGRPVEEMLVATTGFRTIDEIASD